MKYVTFKMNKLNKSKRLKYMLYTSIRDLMKKCKQNAVYYIYWK